MYASQWIDFDKANLPGGVQAHIDAPGVTTPQRPPTAQGQCFYVFPQRPGSKQLVLHEILALFLVAVGVDLSVRVFQEYDFERRQCFGLAASPDECPP